MCGVVGLLHVFGYSSAQAKFFMPLRMYGAIFSDGGSDPHWDQTFVFTIDSEVTEVMIKVFDRDTFTADDPLGTAM